MIDDLNSKVGADNTLLSYVIEMVSLGMVLHGFGDRNNNSEWLFILLCLQSTHHRWHHVQG